MVKMRASTNNWGQHTQLSSADFFWKWVQGVVEEVDEVPHSEF